MSEIFDGVLASPLYRDAWAFVGRVKPAGKTTEEIEALDEAAKSLSVTRRRVRAILKKIASAQAFELRLVSRDGASLPMATVITTGGLERAGRVAVKQFSGLFSSLELPGYVITDGKGRVELEHLKKKRRQN